MVVELTPLIDLIYKAAKLQRMQTPQITRLVKLIYLVEVEYFRVKRQRLTSLDWRFYHYGPYPVDFDSKLREFTIRESAWKGGKVSREIVRDEEQFMRVAAEPDLERLVASAVKYWGDADLNALLDYVYFETEPMQNAQRGDLLDFSYVKAPTKQIKIQLDTEKLATLRARLRERAAVYGAIRKRSEPSSELMEGLQTWDDDSQGHAAAGPCSVDVSDLVPRE